MNWSGGCIPGSSVDAFISNGGTAQIASALQTAEALSLTLGENPGESGTVEVSGSHSDVQVGGTIFVGYRGSGTLTITERAGVRSGGGSIASLAGPLWASNGSATVDGVDAAWTGER